MTCSYANCSLPAKALQLCSAHYQQKKKGKELTPIQTRSYKGEKCVFESCERQAVAKKLCRRHRKQLFLCIELTEIKVKRKAGAAPLRCSHESCCEPISAKALCSTHYHQQLRGESLKVFTKLGTQNEILPADDSGKCWMILVDKKGKEKARTCFDAEHLERVRQHRWYASKKYVKADGKMGSIRLSLHRFIVRCPEDMEVDHIDRNPLNNCDDNLRTVTHAQNTENQPLSRASSTGVRNVQAIRQGFYKGLFRVAVTKDGKPTYGGFFRTIEEAAIKAKELREKLFAFSE